MNDKTMKMLDELEDKTNILIRHHANQRYMKDAFNELYELCVSEGDDISIKVLKIVENIMDNHWEVN